MNNIDTDKVFKEALIRVELVRIKNYLRNTLENAEFDFSGDHSDFIKRSKENIISKINQLKEFKYIADYKVIEETDDGIDFNITTLKYPDAVKFSFNLEQE